MPLTPQLLDEWVELHRLHDAARTRLQQASDIYDTAVVNAFNGKAKLDHLTVTLWSRRWREFAEARTALVRFVEAHHKLI